MIVISIVSAPNRSVHISLIISVNFCSSSRNFLWANGTTLPARAEKPKYLGVYTWTCRAAFSQCLWIQKYESSSPLPPWPEVQFMFQRFLRARLRLGCCLKLHSVWLFPFPVQTAPFPPWLPLEHFLCTPFAQESSLQSLRLKEPNLRQCHHRVCFQEHPASSAFKKFCVWIESGSHGMEAQSWNLFSRLSCCCCCGVLFVLFCLYRSSGNLAGTDSFRPEDSQSISKAKWCVKQMIIIMWVKRCQWGISHHGLRPAGNRQFILFKGDCVCLSVTVPYYFLNPFLKLCLNIQLGSICSDSERQNLFPRTFLQVFANITGKMLHSFWCISFFFLGLTLQWLLGLCWTLTLFIGLRHWRVQGICCKESYNI